VSRRTHSNDNKDHHKDDNKDKDDATGAGRKPVILPGDTACQGPVTQSSQNEDPLSLIETDSMNLLLWRHAEAEDGHDDMQRALTKRGRKQAELGAAWLRQHAPADLKVLVSPAVRTRQTADALKLDYTVMPDLAPDAEPANVLAASGWPFASTSVLVIGHQPTLGRVASTLLAGEDLPWTLKKGGIWWLARRQRDEDFQVVVRAVVNPELL
jgi:phosphohistidine phosphatase